MADDDDFTTSMTNHHQDFCMSSLTFGFFAGLTHPFVCSFLNTSHFQEVFSILDG